MPSMLTRNPAALRMALCAAAEESYKNEIADCGMGEIMIGEDEEYPTKEAWISGRIHEWLDEAVVKFDEAGKALGGNSVIGMRYYSLEVGETIVLPSVRVTRVPGGWIYLYRERDVATSVFIPYTEEM